MNSQGFPRVKNKSHAVHKVCAEERGGRALQALSWEGARARHAGVGEGRHVHRALRAVTQAITSLLLLDDEGTMSEGVSFVSWTVTACMTCSRWQTPPGRCTLEQEYSADVG